MGDRSTEVRKNWVYEYDRTNNKVIKKISALGLLIPVSSNKIRSTPIGDSKDILLDLPVPGSEVGGVGAPSSGLDDNEHSSIRAEDQSSPTVDDSSPKLTSQEISTSTGIKTNTPAHFSTSLRGVFALLDDNPAAVLAHCVSKDFKMSKGIAQQVEFRFEHKRRLKTIKGVKVPSIHKIESDKGVVYHCVTKSKFSSPPFERDVREAIRMLRERCDEDGVEILIVPRFACGLDGLSLPQVMMWFRKYFSGSLTRVIMSTPDFDREEDPEQIKIEAPLKPFSPLLSPGDSQLVAKLTSSELVMKSAVFTFDQNVDRRFGVEFRILPRSCLSETTLERYNSETKGRYPFIFITQKHALVCLFLVSLERFVKDLVSVVKSLEKYLEGNYVFTCTQYSSITDVNALVFRQLLAVASMVDCRAYPHRFVFQVFSQSLAYKLSNQFLKSEVESPNQYIDQVLAPTFAYDKEKCIYNPKRVNVVIPEDYMLNAAVEQRSVWLYTQSVAYTSSKQMFDKLVHLPHSEKLVAVVSNERNAGFYDASLQRYSYEPKNKFKGYKYGFDGKNFVQLEKVKDTQIEIVSSDLLVSDDTVLLNDIRLYESSGRLDMTAISKPRIQMIQGVPGCGKTTYILKQFRASGDLVVCPTREGAEDVRDRLRPRGFTPKFLKTHVRTVDSYIMNGGSESFKRLIVDEALMLHFGSIVLCILKSQVDEVYLIGDKLQIPYINRLPTCSVMYHQVSPALIDDEEFLSVTHRCTLTVATMLSEEYEAVGMPPMMSSNLVTGEFELCDFTNLSDIPKGDSIKVLTFTQSEKHACSQVGHDASTIHEYQGKQADVIVVVRMTNTPSAVYSSGPHILVAVSHHRKSFVYYTADRTDRLASFVRTAQGLTASQLSAHKYKQPRNRGGAALIKQETLLWEREAPLQVHENVWLETSRWGFSSRACDSLIEFAPVQVARNNMGTYTDLFCGGTPRCRRIWPDGKIYASVSGTVQSNRLLVPEHVSPSEYGRS